MFDKPKEMLDELKSEVCDEQVMVLVRYDLNKCGERSDDLPIVVWVNIEARGKDVPDRPLFWFFDDGYIETKPGEWGHWAGKAPLEKVGFFVDERGLEGANYARARFDSLDSAHKAVESLLGEISNALAEWHELKLENVPRAEVYFVDHVGHDLKYEKRMKGE